MWYPLPSLISGLEGEPTNSPTSPERGFLGRKVSRPLRSRHSNKIEERRKKVCKENK
jgi:hypothetical protein